MKYANVASTVAAVGAILALTLVLAQPSQQQQQQMMTTAVPRVKPWPSNVHANVRTDFNQNSSHKWLVTIN